MTINERIGLLINELKLNNNSFSGKIGLNPTVIHNIIKGRNNPSYEVLTKILLSFENVNADWLLLEKGSMLIDNNRRPVPIFNGNKRIMDNESGVPYYEMLPAAAGDLTTFLHEAKPTSYINLPQIVDCIAVLPVYGSSMKGVVEPGDLIALKEVKSRNEFDPALPYLIITEEHRMVKYLHVDNNDNSVIWAESTNHPAIKLQVDTIKMVYAIKCVIRIF